MILAGIDIAKRTFVAAAIDANSELVLRPTTYPQSITGYQDLGTALDQLGATRDQVKIGLEASGHYGCSLHAWLVGQGWKVDVFNPIITGSQVTNVRGRKTDNDDAVSIARTLRDGNYSPLCRQSDNHEMVKVLTRQRRWLVETSSDAKRRLRSLLDQLFPEVDGMFSDLFGAAPLALFAEAPSARLIGQMNIVKMSNLLAEASRNRVSRERAEAIRAAARNSVALTRPNPGTEIAVRQMIATIRGLADQISEIEREIAEVMTKINTPIQSMPGVGPVTAAVIVSEFGDLARFEFNPKRMLAYAGMDPRIRESGQWRGKTRMTKRGSRYLRTSLFQAANMVRLNVPAFQAIYEKHKIAKRKHHAVAISHVVRHLLQAYCAMAKQGTQFEVAKLCFQTA